MFIIMINKKCMIYAVQISILPRKFSEIYFSSVLSKFVMFLGDVRVPKFRKLLEAI